MYSGQVVAIPDSGHDRPRRRMVDILAFARDSRVTVHPVTVLDLSTDGCRLHGGSSFAADGPVWIKLRGLLALQALASRTEDGETVCTFDPPLEQSSIDQLEAVSRQAVRALKGHFGGSRPQPLRRSA